MRSLDELLHSGAGSLPVKLLMAGWIAIGSSLVPLSQARAAEVGAEQASASSPITNPEPAGK
ncbi:hypothetical protein [Paenibacillus tyrfis]|uniref:hypothetical protein n=1 Tax=Paenibacillus tyrfis TaxID=1501230 RepID=UPI0020A093B8|nr:hypothetical protein [Paenibacillus tyrfis]MCP1306157.1 hypothetical protein [Paenibacillus tyrfis]